MPAILTAFPIAIFIVGITAVVGWIMNIAKIVGTLGDPTVTPMFVARIVGVFLAPLGAVLGFF